MYSFEGLIAFSTPIINIHHDNVCNLIIFLYSQGLNRAWTHLYKIEMMSKKLTEHEQILWKELFPDSQHEVTVQHGSMVSTVNYLNHFI